MKGMPNQVTYLIDEAMTISKGANSVINYLDHFLANYSVIGECSCTVTGIQLHSYRTKPTCEDHPPNLFRVEKTCCKRATSLCPVMNGIRDEVPRILNKGVHPAWSKVL